MYPCGMLRANFALTSNIIVAVPNMCYVMLCYVPVRDVGRSCHLSCFDHCSEVFYFFYFLDLGY